MNQPTDQLPLIIKPKARRNWLKFTLLGMLLFMVLFTGAGMGFTLYYGNSIQDRILKELNKKLKPQITVRGKVNFSVFSFFPNASLEINDILVMGSTGAPNDTLLKAGKLSLLMNVFDVINRKWEIKSIVIEKGTLNMVKRSDGVINYELAKNDGSKDTSSIFVNVREAVLKDINAKYIDKVDQAEVALAVNEISLEGNFSSEQLNIKAEAAFTVKTAQLKGIDYGKDKKVTLAGTFQAATAKNSYTVKSDNIFIADNHFSLNGTYTQRKDESDMDVKVKGIDLSINGLLKLFPEQVAKNWNDYNASGNLEFEVNTKGTLSKTKNPQITITYKVNKTNLRYNKLNKDIKDLSFNGTYTNGTKQNIETSVVSVKGMNAYLGDKPIYAQFDISNLSDPSISLEADGYLGLDFINSLLPDSSKFHDLKGGLMIEGLNYKGRLEDLKPTSDKIPEIKGNFTFQDVHLRYDTTGVDLASGIVKLNPSGIELNKVNMKLANSIIDLQGTVQDWKGYTYALLNTAPMASKPMLLSLTATADKIVFENFVNMAGPATTSSTTVTPTSLAEILNLAGTITVRTKSFSYQKFKADDAMGIVTFSPSHIELKELSLKTMGGMFQFSSTVNVKGNNTEILSTLHGTDIDVSEMFAEMNNFGQQQMTNKNIKGKLTTNMKINTYLVDGKVDMPKLYALAEVKIDNGELVSFKPLKSLSKFIDIKELEDVKFQNLQNTIEIKNEVINIPQMIIKTSALNLSFAGTQNFNNIIDYRIKINAFDMLAKKLKKRKFAPDTYEVVDDNSFNFFISMKGPIDNPTITYDKQSVVQRFKQQGTEIKNNLKGVREKYNTDKEKHDWQTNDEQEFIDWDKK